MGKWANIRKINEPMPGRLSGVAAALRPMADEVHRRTGMSACIDLMRDSLCFGFGEDAILVEYPVWRDRRNLIPCRFDPATDGVGVDDIVRDINYQRVPYRVKETWRRNAARNVESDNQREIDRALDGQTDNIRKTMHRTYERHTMGRHYRPSVMVSGLKGAS